MSKKSGNPNGTNRSRAARSVQAASGAPYSTALTAVRAVADRIPPVPRSQWVQEASDLLAADPQLMKPRASDPVVLVSVDGITVYEYVGSGSRQYRDIMARWCTEWDEPVCSEGEALECARQYAAEFIARAESLDYIITDETYSDGFGRDWQVDFRARHQHLPFAVRVMVDVRGKDGATQVGAAEVRRNGDEWVPERLFCHGDEPVPLLYCESMDGAVAMLTAHHGGISDALNAVWDALVEREEAELQAKMAARTPHVITADDEIREPDDVIDWLRTERNLLAVTNGDSYWLDTGEQPLVSVHQDPWTGEWTREQWRKKKFDGPISSTPLGSTMTFRQMHAALTE